MSLWVALLWPCPTLPCLHEEMPLPSLLLHLSAGARAWCCLSLALFFPLLVLVNSSRMRSALECSPQRCSRPITFLLCLLQTENRLQMRHTARSREHSLPMIMEGPGSQSLNWTIDCWGPGSVPHAHHFELYFCHSARLPSQGEWGPGESCPRHEQDVGGTTAPGTQVRQRALLHSRTRVNSALLCLSKIARRDGFQCFSIKMINVEDGHSKYLI